MALPSPRRIPLRDDVQNRFQQIALDPDALTAFRQGIGDPNAPSRVKIAAAIAGATSVLDVGCGPCVLAATLRQRPPSVGFTYTGVDFAQSMVSLAPPQTVAQLADGDQLPFADQSFDAVVLRHVLEHLPEPLPVLTEAVRVTKKQLVVVFSQAPGDYAASLMTDTYLGVPRWAHVESKLLAAITATLTLDSQEWNSTTQPRGLSFKEAFWLAHRGP